LINKEKLARQKRVSVKNLLSQKPPFIKHENPQSSDRGFSYIAGFLGKDLLRMIKVCLAGATGWAGSELARSIAKEQDMSLVSSVSRSHAGRNLGDVLGEPELSTPIFSSMVEALTSPCEVFVEYTKPDSA
jgi:hypothetical protein